MVFGGAFASFVFRSCQDKTKGEGPQEDRPDPVSNRRPSALQRPQGPEDSTSEPPVPTWSLEELLRPLYFVLVKTKLKEKVPKKTARTRSRTGDLRRSEDPKAKGRKTLPLSHPCPHGLWGSFCVLCISFNLVPHRPKLKERVPKKTAQTRSRNGDLRRSEDPKAKGRRTLPLSHPCPHGLWGSFCILCISFNLVPHRPKIKERVPKKTARTRSRTGDLRHSEDPKAKDRRTLPLSHPYPLAKTKGEGPQEDRPDPVSNRRPSALRRPQGQGLEDSTSEPPVPTWSLGNFCILCISFNLVPHRPILKERVPKKTARTQSRICDLYHSEDPKESLSEITAHTMSAPDAAAPGGAPGAPGAPGGEGAPGGGPPPAPPNTSSNRRLQQTQAQVEEVVDIMRVNVDKVLERDQKLSELDDRADALQAGASQFESCAAKLKNKYWWKNCKMMIMMGIIGAIVVGIIFLYFFS
ncbi:vesicle-associated membrane protein 1-like [Astyanax mexicanus]|uniref:Vesicle-associated membrane protein 1-like n=2 Tax=Astyanax mexicanus TaxID=7994 RepID=A0A8T2LXS4_ASTMX|nr:vesicle-associated membrane protein 1-like [Astyanax mexicanus]